MLKKLSTSIIIGVTSLSLISCTTREKEVTKWGLGGAAVGTVGGALLGNGGGAVLAGAAVGAVAGSLIGYVRTKNGVRYCKYRDKRGHIYEARCR